MGLDTDEVRQAAHWQQIQWLEQRPTDTPKCSDRVTAGRAQPRAANAVYHARNAVCSPFCQLAKAAAMDR